MKILGRGWSKLTSDRFIFREILFWSDLEGRIYSIIMFLVDFEGFSFFEKNGFLQNRSNMLYLGIFILPRDWEIKFHGDRPSRISIWTNLDPKSSIFDIFTYFLTTKSSTY